MVMMFFFHYQSQSVLLFHGRHWGTQIYELWKQTAWVEQCLISHGGAISPSSPPQNNLFFSYFCILKFWLMHLHLSITSKRIKLQMWDCAQKKALEKSFKSVTNKSCPEWTKGAKIGYRKSCVFFNSGSTDSLNKV